MGMTLMMMIIEDDGDDSDGENDNDDNPRLSENGYQLAHRYWPEEGSEQYHIFEVSNVVFVVFVYFHIFEVGNVVFVYLYLMYTDPRRGLYHILRSGTDLQNYVWSIGVNKWCSLKLPPFF